jgi:hypothetical protein
MPRRSGESVAGIVATTGEALVGATMAGKALVGTIRPTADTTPDVIRTTATEARINGAFDGRNESESVAERANENDRHGRLLGW